MQYTCGKNKDTIEFEFPEGIGKKILISVSGGADSAIMLYILAKMNRDLNLNHEITTFTVPRPDGGANYSPKIVEWISNKLHVDIPAPIIFGNGNLPHQVVMKIVVKQLEMSKLYDFLFMGGNKVPPIKIDGILPVRSPQNRYEKISFPFWGVTKDCTLDLYYIEDVPELLKLSHSCTEQTIGRCNKCFQCVERAWGFSTLGLTDPGSQ